MDRCSHNSIQLKLRENVENLPFSLPLCHFRANIYFFQLYLNVFHTREQKPIVKGSRRCSNQVFFKLRKWSYSAAGFMFPALLNNVWSIWWLLSVGDSFIINIYSLSQRRHGRNGPNAWQTQASLNAKYGSAPWLCQGWGIHWVPTHPMLMVRANCCCGTLLWQLWWGSIVNDCYLI